MRSFLSSLCTSFVLFPSKLALFKPPPSLRLCETETPVQASQDLVIGKITSFGNRQSRCVPHITAINSWSNHLPASDRASRSPSWRHTQARKRGRPLSGNTRTFQRRWPGFAKRFDIALCPFEENTQVGLGLGRVGSKAWFWHHKAARKGARPSPAPGLEKFGTGTKFE